MKYALAFALVTLASAAYAGDGIPGNHGTCGNACAAAGTAQGTPIGTAPAGYNDPYSGPSPAKGAVSASSPSPSHSKNGRDGSEGRGRR